MESTIRVYRLNKPLGPYGKDDQTVVLTNERNRLIKDGSVLEDTILCGYDVTENGRVYVIIKDEAGEDITGEEIIPKGKIVIAAPLRIDGTARAANIDSPVVTAYTEITSEQYTAFQKDADSKTPAFQEKREAILETYNPQFTEIEKQKEELKRQKEKQEAELKRQKSKLFKQCQAELSKLDNPTLENTVEASLF